MRAETPSPFSKKIETVSGRHCPELFVTIFHMNFFLWIYCHNAQKLYPKFDI